MDTTDKKEDVASTLFDDSNKIQVDKDRGFFNDDSCDAYAYDIDIYDCCWEDTPNWEADMFLEVTQAGHRFSFYTIESLDAVLETMLAVKEKYAEAIDLAKEKNGKDQEAQPSVSE